MAVGDVAPGCCRDGGRSVGAALAVHAVEQLTHNRPALGAVRYLERTEKRQKVSSV